MKPKPPDAVRKMGIPVYFGQKAENIEGADLIIYTAAIMADNPRLIAPLQASGVHVLERSEVLGLITSWYDICYMCCRNTWQNYYNLNDYQILHTAQIELICFYRRENCPPLMVAELLVKVISWFVRPVEFVDTFLKLYPYCSYS